VKGWLAYLRWRAMRVLGRSGLVALLLLLPSALISAWLPRLESHTRELQAAVETSSALLLARPNIRRVSNGERAAGFAAGFPTPSQSAEDIDAIFTMARRHRLNLLKGEYQLKAEPRSPFVTYTATFPVSADYATLKLFTIDVLTTLPHVALDELRMTRNAAGDTMLDATVRFTMIYRST